MGGRQECLTFPHSGAPFIFLTFDKVLLLRPHGLINLCEPKGSPGQRVGSGILFGLWGPSGRVYHVGTLFEFMDLYCFSSAPEKSGPVLQATNFYKLVFSV